jgi:uncharacterized protein YoxC
MVISLAATPVFAYENQNGSMIKNQEGNAAASLSLTPLTMKDNNGNKKDKDNDLKKALKKFFDSSEFDWAEKSIEKMGAMGILNGVGNGYFKPKNNVTHVEAIAMVLKLEGLQTQAEAIKTQPEYFKGLCDPWSYGYLKLALDKGIIIPEEDGKFNPKTPAKRHEIAKYIVRALGMREDALDNMKADLDFKDADAIPKSSVGYVYIINELEIMMGSNNEFQPNKPITRAEVAVIIDRAENNMDTEVPNKPSVTAEGTFVSYNEDTHKLTLKSNDKTTVYEVNSNAPVYKDAKYYSISSLEPGDVIKIILDSQKKIIFIEVVKESTTTPTGEELSIRNVDYDDLPEELQDVVDTQKLTQSYTAYKYENSIYLIAARGKKSTGGYTINIDEVYKDTVSTNRYNLRAVVDMENPGDFATTGITYPYDIVKLTYFDGIQKVKFINSSDSVLAQTTIKVIEEVEVIEGKIESVDAANKKIRLQESNDIVRTYIIPTNAVITLDNRTVRLSSLTENMPAAITKTNGVITKLAAESEISEELSIRNVDYDDLPEVLQDAVDKQKLTQSYTAYRYENSIYLIAARGKKSTGGYTINIDDVYKETVVTNKYNLKVVVDMTNPTSTSTQQITYPYDIVKLTYFDGIQKVNFVNTSNASLSQTTVQKIDVIETIKGVINSVDTANRRITLLDADNTVKTYSIPTSVVITLDNRTSSFSALTKNMPVTITRTNGTITKLAAQSAAQVIETISGKIDSVDTINKNIILLEADNNLRAYHIPTNVTITLNGKASSLAALAEDMAVVLTRTNGTITKLAATNLVENISGKINSVDTEKNIVKLLENDNIVRTYTIPEDVQITLDNTASDLSDLEAGMKAVLTRTNGVITKLTVQNDIQKIEGLLITTYTSQGKTFISVKVGTAIKAYEITSSTEVIYNDASVTIDKLPLNSIIIISLENGEVLEVENK